jgi:acetaldehyde dehydrogenase (acetylating)
MDKDLQSIQEARRLVEAAHAAWKQFEEFSEERVEVILEAISSAGIAHARTLAEMAVEETGFGRVEDKTLKNLFCARDVYAAIRGLKTVGIVSDDKEKKIIEVASPVGVIAGIIPSTNPTSTTIYKALIALKGRNAIVFSPHPSAVRSINETVRIVREAAEGAGAPPGVLSSMETPTMEGTNELMKNRQTAVILATGGPGLVQAAYSAGKPAFGVGPGNVPAYIEQSADVARAVGHVLTGKCFDNGTLCSSEQSLIADEAIRDEVLAQLSLQGAYVCNDAESQRLESVIQTPAGTLNLNIVGQSATRIAEMAGIEVPTSTRALVGMARGVGRQHPLSMEKLCPVLAFYSVKDWREGCQKCIDILNFGGLGHTLGLHSTDDGIIRQFALQKPAYRICVNTPAALGAVGYTTNLFPSMTLGCGAFGGNITSDNISPLHLINLKRVAFGVREVESATSAAESTTSVAKVSEPLRSGAIDRNQIASIVDGWLAGKTPPPRSATPPAAVPQATVFAEQAGTAPPLANYEQLEPSAAPPPSSTPTPAEFVSEDDVRTAAAAHRKIIIDAHTIITPSARDLGAELDVFAGND